MTRDAATETTPRVSREGALAETFVLLADTLVEDYDVVDLLDSLVTAAVSLFEVDAAGLLLDDQRGHLTVVASSSEEMRLLEVFQIQNDEGPCLDCVRSRTPVSSSDLIADRERWPLFVDRAVAAGFRSVTAVPLRLRDQTIGGLNMFNSEPIKLPALDERLAQALADVATIGILQHRTIHRNVVVAEQLQHALHSRVVIEQAKGVIAERHGVDMNDAFAALRRHARDHNLKLTALAHAIVRGTTDPSTIVAGPTSP